MGEERVEERLVEEAGTSLRQTEKPSWARHRAMALPLDGIMESAF